MEAPGLDDGKSGKSKAGPAFTGELPRPAPSNGLMSPRSITKSAILSSSLLLVAPEFVGGLGLVFPGSTKGGNSSAGTEREHFETIKC